MKETKRIAQLFEDLYDGEPWIDETLQRTLKNISVEKAAIKISPGRNSIWQIVNHLISWRENVLQRVQGKVIVTPENNYFDEIKDASEKAWQETHRRLRDSQKKWITFLLESDGKTFEKIYPKNGLSYYSNIHGIIQHDAYHLGQIVLLSKLIDGGFSNPESSKS